MVRNTLLKILPEPVLARARLLRHAMTVSIPAVHHFVCPLCDYKGAFLPYGLPIRPNAKCANCGSLERHRQFFLWLTENDKQVREKSVLHFAPEPPIRALLESRASRYIAGDLEPGAADRVLNIESIDLPDASIDIVFCSHVLEHVDDRKALGELHRILRGGGVAIIMVPIIEGWEQTYENPAIVTPEGRDLHFGQDDHVRYYGPDVRDRIEQAGFDLREFKAVEPQAHAHALLRGETIFLAQKP